MWVRREIHAVMSSCTRSKAVQKVLLQFLNMMGNARDFKN